MNRIEDLQRLCEKATNGPWEVFLDDSGDQFTGWPMVTCEKEDISIVHRAGFKQEFWGDLSIRDAQTNANFIAASRTALPQLLELVEVCREALAVIPSTGSQLGTVAEKYRVEALTAIAVFDGEVK